MISWITCCFRRPQQAAQVPGVPTSSAVESQTEPSPGVARNAVLPAEPARTDVFLATTLDMDRFGELDQADASTVTSLEEARQVILRLKARVRELEGSGCQIAESTLTSLRHIRLLEQDPRAGATPGSSKRGNESLPSVADTIRELRQSDSRDEHKSVPHTFSAYTKQELVELLGRAGKPSAAVLLQAVCEEDIGNVPPALLLDVDPAVGDSVAGAPELLTALKNGGNATEFAQLASIERLPSYLRLRLYMMQACGARPILAYATASARALFKARTDRQLQYVLEGQVQQDAMLGMLLQEMLDEMLSAPVSRCSATSMANRDLSTIVMHSVSHFVNTSNPKVFPFVPVTMRGCGYKKSTGEVVPCIIFEFAPDSNQGDFLKHLQRDYTMMGHISAIITLFTLKGDVLHQNAGSIAYYGYQRLHASEKRRGSAHGGRNGKHTGPSVADALDPSSTAWLQQDERPTLTKLFQLAPPDALEGMLESMVQGGVWRSILPVPPTLTAFTRPPASPGVMADPLAGLVGLPPGAAFMGPDPDNIFTMDGFGFTAASVTSLAQPCDEPFIGNRQDAFEGSFALGTSGASAERSMLAGGPSGHAQAHARSIRALKAVPEQSQEHERVSFAQHRQTSSAEKGDIGGPLWNGLLPGGAGGNIPAGAPVAEQVRPPNAKLTPRSIRSSSTSIQDASTKLNKMPRRSTTFSAIPSGVSDRQLRPGSGSTMYGMGTGALVSFTGAPAVCNSSPRMSRIRRRSGLPMGLDGNPAVALSQSTWGLYGNGTAYEQRHDKGIGRDASGADGDQPGDTPAGAGCRLTAATSSPIGAAGTTGVMGPYSAASPAAGVLGASGPSHIPVLQRSEATSPPLISPSQSSQVDQWQQWQYRHSQWQDALHSQSQPSQASIMGYTGISRMSNHPHAAWFLHQQHQAGFSQSSSSAANQSCANSSSRRGAGGGGGSVVEGVGGDTGGGVQRQSSVEGMARRQRSVALGEGMPSPTARSTPTPSAGSLVSPLPSAHQHTDSNIMGCATFVAIAGSSPSDPSQPRPMTSLPPSQPSRFFPAGSPMLVPGGGGGASATAAIAAVSAAEKCHASPQLSQLPPHRATSESLDVSPPQPRTLFSVMPSVPTTTASISLSGAANPGMIGGVIFPKHIHNNGTASGSVRRAPMRQSERSNPNLVLPRVGSVSVASNAIKSATSFSFGSKAAAAAAAGHHRPLVRMMSFLNTAPASGTQQQQQQQQQPQQPSLQQHFHLHGFNTITGAQSSTAQQRHIAKRAASGQLNLDPVMRTGSSKITATGDGSLGAFMQGGVSSQSGSRHPPSTFLCGSAGFRRQSTRTPSSAALVNHVSEVDESSSLAAITTMATLGYSRDAAAGAEHRVAGGAQCRSSFCAAEYEVPQMYHEIIATPFLDPVSKSQVVMVVQTDVTARVQLERRLADVMEAEHKLLENIFPRHVLEHIAHSAAVNEERASQFNLRMLSAMPDLTKTATDHEQVTILFADIVGFTSMCKEVPAKAVMKFLNDLYTRFDTLLDIYGVYKVETIGDCYMVAGGLISKDADGFSAVRKDSCDNLQAWRVLSFAKAMLRDAQKVLLPTTHEAVKLRVGIHTGPVVSGVVGTRMPRFCLFGDTINTASRMESTCPYGRIQVSAATHALVPEEDWEPTGGVMVKGKGIMETYLLKQSSSITLPSNLASASMSTPGLPDQPHVSTHGSSNLSRLGIRPAANGLGSGAQGSGTSGGIVAGSSTGGNASVAHGVISAVTEKIPAAGAAPSGGLPTVPARNGMGASPRDASRLGSSGSGKNTSFLFNTVW